MDRSDLTAPWRGEQPREKATCKHSIFPALDNRALILPPRFLEVGEQRGVVVLQILFQVSDRFGQRRLADVYAIRRQIEPSRLCNGHKKAELPERWLRHLSDIPN